MVLARTDPQPSALAAVTDHAQQRLSRQVEEDHPGKTCSGRYAPRSTLMRTPGAYITANCGVCSLAHRLAIRRDLISIRACPARVTSQHGEEAKCRNHQRHPRRHPIASKMPNQP